MLLQTTLVFQQEDEEEEKEGEGMQTIKFSCLLDDPCRKKDVLLWVLLQGTTGPISIVPKRFGSSNWHASSPSTHNIHTHNCQLMTQLQIQLPLSLLSVNPLCFSFSARPTQVEDGFFKVFDMSNIAYVQKASPLAIFLFTETTMVEPK